MSIKKLGVAAIAALGLSVGAYAASAGPLNDGVAPSPLAKSPSTFTLIFHGGGGGGGHMGGGMAGGHFGGMGGMHFGGPGIGARSFAGPGMNRGFHGGRTAFFRPGIAGRGFNGGRMAFHNGHRGFWRHGRFFPFVGVGLWDSDYGYGGGSCYSNCLAAGYGPRFCSANAYSFCY
jgi:hypothetical protein